MKTIEEQLDKLGPEYRTKLELFRQQQWTTVAPLILQEFKMQKDVNELEDKGIPFMSFLQMFFDIGFYRGVEYGLDTEENHIVEDGDILTKYQDEIAAEGGFGFVKPGDELYNL